MNLDSRQGSAQGASINMEDLDDEIDLNKVKLVKYYLSESFDTMYMHTLDSQLGVRDVLNRIISDGASILYEKYIESRINKYCLDYNHEFLVGMMQHALVLFDNRDFEVNNNVDEDDCEPVPCEMDTWLRNRILVERKTYLDTTIDKENSPDPSIHSDVKSVAASLMSKQNMNRTKGTLSLTNTSILENVQPKPLEDEHVITQKEQEEKLLEDQLRIQKERELKVKEDKNIQDKLRKEELKHQQNQMNRFTGDPKQKNYTYDYDGNIIMIKFPDKLPPVSYPISSEIKDTSTLNQQSDQAKDRKAGPRNSDMKSKMVTQLKQQPGKKTDAIPEKILPVAPPIFDAFQPQTGVTFIDGARTKEGPKTDYSSINLNNLSTLLNETTTGGNIRLSKNEYIQITRGGNLSRSQNYSAGNTQGTEEGQNNTGLASNNSQLRVRTEEDPKLVNQSESELYSVLQMKKAKKNIQASGKIKVNMMKHIDSLISDQNSIDNFDNTSLFLPKLNEKDKRNKTDEDFKSPIDAFNINILKQRDWGKSALVSSSLPAIKPMTKSSNTTKHLKSTIGVVPKNPRDRLAKNSLSSITSQKHLPPPMIGNTVGHGVKDGINPSKSLQML